MSPKWGRSPAKSSCRRLHCICGPDGRLSITSRSPAPARLYASPRPSPGSDATHNYERAHIRVEVCDHTDLTRHAQPLLGALL